MSKPTRWLSSIALKNFKAIRNSKSIKLSPLTVFIGNNGSGKSSVIEAIETYQTFLGNDLDEAFLRWHGFEHIRNQSLTRKSLRSEVDQSERSNAPIEFKLRGKSAEGKFSVKTVVNERGNGNELFVELETIKTSHLEVSRDVTGAVEFPEGYVAYEHLHSVNAAYSAATLDEEFCAFIDSWQVLNLNPAAMGAPRPQYRTRRRVKLAKDGSNVAEYLLDIRQRDLAAFDGIVETLKWVLPYAADVQPDITRELERSVYLQLAEDDFKLPGWLLSSGTLRVLALLAVLRHPDPPPLVLIEELENGLDPRTIHLIVDEIQAAVQSGRSQVIITTHSPYLLDLLPLSSVMLCEREDGGEPTFFRPADDEELATWAKNFGPGQLYTMSRLSRRKGR